jgi:hypothetical protein
LAAIEHVGTGGQVSGKAMTNPRVIEFADYNGVLGVRLHPKPAGKGKAKR